MPKYDPVSMETEESEAEINLTEENLVTFLEDDVTFVQYFNAYLALPVFTNRLLYNPSSGGFEEFHNELVGGQIGKAENRDENGVPVKYSYFSAKEEMETKIHYKVKLLDKDSGMNWVKKNRLPGFIESELFVQYKLSLLLSAAQLDLIDTLVNEGEEDISVLAGHEAYLVHKSFEEVVSPEVSEHSGRDYPEEVEETEEEEEEESYPEMIDGINLKELPEWQRNQLLEEHKNNQNNDGSASSGSSDGSRSENGDEETDSFHEEDILARVENAIKKQSRASAFIEDGQYRRFSTMKPRIGVVPTLGFIEEDEEEEEESLSSSRISHHQPKSPMGQQPSIRVEDFEQSINSGRFSQSESSRKLSESIERMQHNSLLELNQENLKMFERGTPSARVILKKRRLEQLLFKHEPLAINLKYKLAVDLFQEFLHDSHGEPYLLLWCELERTQKRPEEERIRTLARIRERFIRSGSPYEIPTEKRISWGIRDVSQINIDLLLSLRKKIIHPLLCYWCHRFTMHQMTAKKTEIEKVDKKISDAVEVHVSTHSPWDDLPPRPKTSQSLGPQSEVSVTKLRSRPGTAPASKIASSSSSSMPYRPENRTQRCKSAMSRPKTGPAQNINVGYQQLKLISSYTIDQGFGFRETDFKTYNSDAADDDYRSNTRLFITPVPPLNCQASTLKNVPGIEEVFEKARKKSEEELQLQALVKTMLHEENSGNFFEKFLQKENNQIWTNCYAFWKALQDYNELFYVEKFNPKTVQRKANTIYNSFILDDGPSSINCEKDMRNEIHKCLDPAYEELFDAAEEMVLGLLVVPWKMMKEEQSSLYSDVNVTEEMKAIEVLPPNKYIHKKLQTKDLEEVEIPEDNPQENDRFTPEQLKLPPPMFLPGSGEMAFDDLLKDKNELREFKAFLEGMDEKATMDLSAWTDMELFRRLPDRVKEDVRDERACNIRERWLNKSYFFGKRSPASPSAQTLIMKMVSSTCRKLPARPPNDVILEAQKYCRARVERHWMQLYWIAKSTNTIRKKKMSALEQIEDVMFKKKKEKSESAWRVLNNSRWNSSSHDVTALRQTLLDPNRCEHFREYVSVKGEYMSNNVIFWLEVQKYKELCHNHVERFILQQKITTICDVFIKSQVGPELQIDVPIEIANRLYEKAAGKYPEHGPYLFREAQTTVFRMMFSNHWKNYLAYRMEMNDVELSKNLHELTQKHKNEQSVKKMLLERKRLSKLVQEKKKDKSQKSDVMSLIAESLSFDGVEDQQEITYFSYSKYFAEEDLKELDAKIQEAGYIPTSMDDRSSNDVGSKVASRSSRRASSIKSVKITAPNDIGTKENNKPKKLSRITEENTEKKTKETTNNVQSAVNSLKITVDPVTARSDLSEVSQKSKLSDRKMSGFPAKGLVPSLEKRRNSRRPSTKKLTQDAVLEFENSPEGQMLALPIPGQLQKLELPKLQTNSRTMSFSSHSPSETEVQCGLLRLAVPPPSARRLPRNAGTAAIVKKRQAEERERRKREESPPRYIDAAVIVC